MTVSLSNKNQTNLGNIRNHWDIMLNGQKLGQAGKDNSPFSKWSFMSADGATYETFKTKTDLLAFVSP